MDVKTYDDAVEASEKLDIEAGDIAEAFGIPVPVDSELMEELNREFENAVSNTNRWAVFRDAPVNSELGMKALTAILEHASTTQERWEVFNSAPEGSEVRKQAIRLLCSTI
jgi:hypothetical protein